MINQISCQDRRTGGPGADKMRDCWVVGFGPRKQLAGVVIIIGGLS